MLTLSTRLETVHQATSVEERDAIYRFRYEVMIEQRGHTEQPDQP